MTELKTLKGEELKNLVEKWKAEMDSRSDSWTSIIGLGGLIRMTWWGYFQSYRLSYFMILCTEGVATAIAWKKAKEWKKVEITESINSYGWAL
jgi:hypothetical protein